MCSRKWCIICSIRSSYCKICQTCCTCVLILIIIFSFFIYLIYFFAFVHRCNTLYTFKMHIRNHILYDVSHFRKTCILWIVGSWKILALVAWRNKKILGIQKQVSVSIFWKKCYGKAVFFGKSLRYFVSAFYNPVRLPLYYLNLQFL